MRPVLGVPHRQEVAILGVEEKEEPEEHHEGRPVQLSLVGAGVDTCPCGGIDAADESVDDVLVQALGEALAEGDGISARSCPDAFEAAIRSESVGRGEGAEKWCPPRRQEARVEFDERGRRRAFVE